MFTLLEDWCLFSNFLLLSVSSAGQTVMDKHWHQWNERNGTGGFGKSQLGLI